VYQPVARVIKDFSFGVIFDTYGDENFRYFLSVIGWRRLQMGGISKTGNNVHFNNVQNRDVEQKSKKGEKRSSHILSLSSRLSNIKESIARKIDRDYSLRHGVLPILHNPALITTYPNSIA
jgi:hypothetical protein